MLRLADAGVNQRGGSVAARDQVRVVARPGHRTGGVGGQEDRVHLETIPKRDRGVIFFDEKGLVSHMGTSFNAKDVEFRLPTSD